MILRKERPNNLFSWDEPLGSIQALLGINSIHPVTTGIAFSFCAFYAL